MKKRTLIIAAMIILIAAGVVAFAVLRPPAEASQPISAVPLSTETASAAYPEGAAAANPTAYPAGVTPEAPPAASSSEAVLFQIVPEESSLRFIIDEVLAGNPKTVIGETNQVAGQIDVNFSNPAASRVGVVQVNARTLVTDNEFRNRAIKNQILQTDTYEFVTFTPTSMEGLPASVQVGDTFTFTITGDLTIREITKPVTFEVEVTVASETSLTGKASTTIQRADFNLVIPQVPNVANVSEAVGLEIDFSASK